MQNEIEVKNTAGNPLSVKVTLTNTDPETALTEPVLLDPGEKTKVMLQEGALLRVENRSPPEPPAETGKTTAI